MRASGREEGVGWLVGFLPAPALRAFFVGPPVALMAVLWWSSSQPDAPGPEVDDKLAHVLAYGLLAALWVRAQYFLTTWPIVRLTLTAMGASLGYGAIDELHQSYVPGRDASLLDLLADAAGAVLGALLAAGFYVLGYAWARRRAPKPPSALRAPPEP